MVMRSSSGLELRSETVGALPIVNHFLRRVGLDDVLSAHVPCDDRRLRVAPSAALGVVVRNLIVDHEPVYALSEWAAGYGPALLGLEPGGVELLNDDRVGRSLDRLFDADRASLLTEVVLRAVRALGSTAPSCTTTPPRSASPALTATLTGAAGAASPPPPSPSVTTRTTGPTCANWCGS